MNRQRDWQARINIWEIVLELKELVDQGKIIAVDTPKNLIHRLTKEREIHLNFVGGSHTAEAVKEIVSEYPSVIRAEQKDSLLYIWSEKPEEAFFIGQ
jgi:ABC-2 type transport system ATP-binding protein